MSVSFALLISAIVSIVLIAYWVGKLVGEANTYVICALAYKHNKEATCKALEQLIEEKDL